jgi:hypothetical protein
LEPTQKLIILDDIDESKLNIKYKLVFLGELRKQANHIICSADETLLLNLNVAPQEEILQIAEFKSYRLRDMGHARRDQIIQRWYQAGREETITDDELFNIVETSRNIIDGVLGTNFVARKPLIILILLQAIESGHSEDFAHRGFVRYYKYLIDTALLTNIPKSKIELYYAFLPEIAYACFQSDNQMIGKEAFSALNAEFAERKGLHLDSISAVQSSLITLGVMRPHDGGFRFKYSFIYYYFLGQYFSDHMAKSDVKQRVVDICNNLHIRENANIIVFTSYHTPDLVLENVLRVANSLFTEEEPFNFTQAQAQALNHLVDESPRVLISPQVKTERAKLIKARDQVEEKDSDDTKNPQDFSARLDAGWRSAEIIGQMLKNHFAKFDAGPKRELYLAGSLVMLRMLNTFLNLFMKDTEALASSLKAKIPTIETEKDARRAVFGIANFFVCGLIKACSKNLGTDTLSKTYEDVTKQEDTTIFRVLSLTIKLDAFEKFPMEELRALAEECKDNKLAMTTLRFLVRIRLYMRPIEDRGHHQQICDAIGLSPVIQLIQEKKGAA